MIEIKDALAKVAEATRVLPTTDKSLVDLAGHVLAEAVTSDVSSPPFDKSMMDGFAIRAGDFENSNANSLEIVARIMAGSSFEGTLQDGQAAQIMTGAPVPAGADAVVMVEETEEAEDRVTINAKNVKLNQNILPLGMAMKVGQAVLPVGHFVRPEDIGPLAESGGAVCQVIRRPSLAVIATGDELVDAATTPSANQIRNSNGPMLVSLAKRLCQQVHDLGIGADEREQLRQKIEVGLQSDVLVLSGGVSAGVADLVPGVLQEANVEQVFHKVRIKPGKPVWFGVLDKPDGQRTLVFGLPGNPVSSMVCFHVFVAPALAAMAGRDVADLSKVATLATEHSHRPGRTTYWPCRLQVVEQRQQLTPLDWKGSADLRTLAQANCFGIFDGERTTFAVGEQVELLVMG